MKKKKKKKESKKEKEEKEEEKREKKRESESSLEYDNDNNTFYILWYEECTYIHLFHESDELHRMYIGCRCSILAAA